MALLADVFPARITTPEKTYEKARLFVFETKAYIFTEEHGQVSLADESPVTSFQLSRMRGAPTIVTTEQGTWEALRSGSCGCGSKLKTFAWQTVISD